MHNVQFDAFLLLIHAPKTPHVKYTMKCDPDLDMHTYTYSILYRSFYSDSSFKFCSVCVILILYRNLYTCMHV